jgi:phospholipid/cholesterol/gamma-HCH transport system permease protein
MTTAEHRLDAPRRLGRHALRWLAGWWNTIHLGALILALGLSPSSYSADNRRAFARHIVASTLPVLAGFTVVWALIGVVVIRIVVVTAISYGLSQYAVEMVVRVLVMELIPMATALFVALRFSIPESEEISNLRAFGTLGGEQERGRGIAGLQREVLPRVAAAVFSVCLLAAVACVVTLVLAYLAVYGFNPWGFEAYTRIVGRIFGPAVTLIFGMKVLALALAISLIPAASALFGIVRAHARTEAELRGLVRMFIVILLVELLSLVGNYA